MGTGALGLSRRHQVGALQVAIFAAAFDGFIFGPMLVDAAGGLDVSLASVAAAVTMYFLCYGLMQPVWGIASDRVGRVAVVRYGLALAVLAAVAAALAPNLGVLVVARAVGGGAMAAVMPSSMTFVGDVFSLEERHGKLADLVAAWAAGTAGGTLGGGAAVELVGWRSGFAACAAIAVVGLVTVSWALEVEKPERRAAIAVAEVGAVVRDRALLVLFILVAAEGGILLAGLTYMAPALESTGLSSGLAGAVIALYGVAGVVWTRLVRPMREWFGALGVLALGGILLVAGYSSAALSVTAIGIGAAAVLVAGTFALMHSSLQAWAAEVEQRRRATVISLFAASFFVGNAAGTQVSAGLADRGAFALLFGTMAVLATGLTVAALLARKWVLHRQCAGR